MAAIAERPQAACGRNVGNGPAQTVRTTSPCISQSRQQLARLTTSACPSPIFRQECLFRLARVSEQLDQLLHGRLTFRSTETWRTVYEDVLKSCQTKRYLSVALIRSDDYWRDKPAENSLEFNYRLIDHGFFVHRLFLIDEFFWAPSVRTPSRDVLDWILKQHDRGIEVSLVRLADLESESDLVVDMGIYGELAVGTQQTDFQGRTTRFELCFKPEQIRLAEEHWNQLQLYAIGLDAVAD